MDFNVPKVILDKIKELDEFIEREIKPLERKNLQFFDHRREHARTDWENGGTPTKEWEALLQEMKKRADAEGHLRFALPKEIGGQNGSNLSMAMIREHFAHKGLGLHNDLQNESSIVGNFPLVHMMWQFGTDAQKEEFLPALITGSRRIGFGLTERNHGSDATYMETTAVKLGDEWVINGNKRFNSGIHDATHDLVFARTSGEPGEGMGITAFLVPVTNSGFNIEKMDWTFNMPTDHGSVALNDVRMPDSTESYLGEEGDGLVVAQTFLHENRIRQAASSLGAAQYCIDEAVAYAKERVTWGKSLSTNQAIQFPLTELHTEAEMVRNLVYKTAWNLDQQNHMAVTDQVSMANYRANRLVCEASDRAMQVFGGEGYTRNQPFEHIYRHHRRYRITEGAEEIQIRKIAGHLFGFLGSNR